MIKPTATIPFGQPMINDIHDMARLTGLHCTNLPAWKVQPRKKLWAESCILRWVELCVCRNMWRGVCKGGGGFRAGWWCSWPGIITFLWAPTSLLLLRPCHWTVYLGGCNMMQYDPSFRIFFAQNNATIRKPSAFQYIVTLLQVQFKWSSLNRHWIHMVIWGTSPRIVNRAVEGS